MKVVVGSPWKHFGGLTLHVAIVWADRVGFVEYPPTVPMDKFLRDWTPVGSR